MGGYLSTSNHVLGTDSSEVTIETDKPIYWSIEFGSSSASASTPALQQARGGEKTGAGAALGGGAAAAAAAAGPYSPSDPFADQVNISSSPSQGRRDSRTTPYLPSRDSDSQPVENLGEDSAPPGPTVAETGEVIPSSPSGPGPLSGTLQPRRRSSAYRGGGGSSISPGISPNQGYLGTAGSGGALSLSPSLPARPPTQRLPSDYSTGTGAEGQGQGQGQGPVGNTTPAYLPPPHASPLTGSAAGAGGRPEVLRVPSADFVSRGGGAGLGGGQGYGGGYGAAPPLGSSTSATATSTGTGTDSEAGPGPVPGGFPSSSSSYPSFTSATATATASEARTSGDGAAGGAGGVGLALASGISHHQASSTDTSTAPGSSIIGGMRSGMGSGVGGVRARIRRDGTITRRGVDSDFDQAESEQLPPYTEM